MKPTEKQLRTIGEKAIKNITPYLTTITGVAKDKKVPSKYIGTGFYIEFQGHVYIASAQHVEDHIYRYDYLFHGVGDKSFPIQGHWVATTVPNADFGVMGCFSRGISPGFFSARFIPACQNMPCLNLLLLLMKTIG